MAKPKQDFEAVSDGQIYPRMFSAGDEVTGDVEPAARAAGVLMPECKPKARKTKALQGAPENK
jgi:hypothetical protein